MIRSTMSKKITTFGADEEDETDFNLVGMTKERRHAEEARIRKNLVDIKVGQIDDFAFP